MYLNGFNIMSINCNLLFTRYKWLEVGMTGSPRSSSRKKIASFLGKYLYQQDFTDRSLSKSRLT